MAVDPDAPVGQLQFALAPLWDYEADYDRPHYPNPDQSYFQFTKSHWQICQSLSPCARSLYEWLLLQGPAGILLRANLCSFQAEIGEWRKKGKPYCLKQIRRALSELEEAKLVFTHAEEIRYKVRHPGAVISETELKQRRQQQRKRDKNVPAGTLKSTEGTKMSTEGTKMSKTRAETTVNQRFQLSPDHDPDLNPDLNPDQLERSEPEILDDPEFLEWIKRRIAKFPTEPAFLDQVIQVELNKEVNQRTFLKIRNTKQRASIPLPVEPIQKIENFPTAEETLAAQIMRKRGQWKAQPAKQAEIRSWCESMGLPCGEDGPQLPPDSDGGDRHA